ncbi:MAG: hypothetical protein K9W44_06645 [Candidatus Lokiarchaeota archaeon]|nr:hypothetical protein [Candidatus Harpocratesius repetitus]
MERTSYLDQTTFAGGSGVDLTGYVTTAKTKKMLSEYRLNQNHQIKNKNLPDQGVEENETEENIFQDIQTHLPIYPKHEGESNSLPADNQPEFQFHNDEVLNFLDEDFFQTTDEIPNDLEEIENLDKPYYNNIDEHITNEINRANNDNKSRDEHTGNNNSYNNQTLENNLESLPSTHFEKFNQKIENNQMDWKEDLKQRFMTALIQARMKMMHEQPSQALLELKNTLKQEIEGLAHHEGSESDFQDCWDLARKSEEVDENRQEAVQWWLDEFEMFVITF